MTPEISQKHGFCVFLDISEPARPTCSPHFDFTRYRAGFHFLIRFITFISLLYLTLVFYVYKSLNFKNLSWIYHDSNIHKTGWDQSRPVVNRSWSELVRTGLVTAKNRKRPVYIGPVRFFGGLGVWRTGLGLGLRPLRLKTETGPDFQSLQTTVSMWNKLLVFFIYLLFIVYSKFILLHGEP